MKKVLLMAVILLTLLFSMNAQEVREKKYTKEYDRYTSKMESKSKEVMDYETWCYKMNYIPYKYVPKFKTQVKTLPPSSPGTYLRKGSNQMLTGLGLGIASGLMVTIAAKSEINNDPDIDTNPILYVAGATALTGFVLEIVGIRNIGKAGLLLNKYGVGISIPIK